MDYAIIRLGGKQYRVREGEYLVVDRVKTDEGQTFSPEVLLGEGVVTAKVLAHERGPKIRIGKYKRRTGYRRHNGFRAATSRIEISLGAPKRAAASKPAPAAQAAPARAGGGRPRRRSRQGHAGRLRGDDGRGDHGGLEGLEPADAGGSAGVRAGAPGAQGRDRRARVGIEGEGGELLMAHKKGLGSSKN